LDASLAFTPIRDDVRDEISPCQPAQRTGGGPGVQIAALAVPIHWQIESRRDSNTGWRAQWLGRCFTECAFVDHKVGGGEATKDDLSLSRC
jgi:hypothetical protein